MASEMTGAEIVLRALADQGVDLLFGYPGGAVLPIYDEMFKQNALDHYLVRHEQGAVHAAEGYARSSGKVGVVLVTSGPGATNAVTGLTDALMDSIPVVCITGQVATHLIGNDAFQECDTVGITRPCTKHNYLVKDINDLARVMHEAFYVAQNGRPGPVVVDIPKDIQFAKGPYISPNQITHKILSPRSQGRPAGHPRGRRSDRLGQAPRVLHRRRRHQLWPEGERAFARVRQPDRLPDHLDADGTRRVPGRRPEMAGMLGMHGTYEANNAMHDCDVMINIGARFDDRITGRLDAFSPGSKKIHVDIDPSSINKNVRVDIPIIGDVAHVLEEMVSVWRRRAPEIDRDALKAGGTRSVNGAGARASGSRTARTSSCRNTPCSASMS